MYKRPAMPKWLKELLRVLTACGKVATTLLSKLMFPVRSHQGDSSGKQGALTVQHLLTV